MADDEGTEGPQTAEDTGEDTDTHTGSGEAAHDDSATGNSDTEPDTFPRAYVERLRSENAKYRQRAAHADQYAARLHRSLVEATGRLADPDDLEYDEQHLDDTDALNSAIDELLDRKPHLASRRPSGDVGQGARGRTGESVSLAGMLRARAG